MHQHLRQSRLSIGGWVAVAGVIGLLAASPMLAQPGFWQPASGPGGGSVAQLVAQPDGDLYAAMHAGPIYRSDNGGATWSPLGRAATGLDALPNGDLYAFDAGGLDRSRDDGATWVHLGAAPAGSNAVAMMPSGTLLLGAITGVWRSTNDGASWDPSTLVDAITSDFVVEGATVYVGVASLLVRSEDDGQTWTTVTTIATQNVKALARRAGGGWWIGTTRTNYFSGPGGLFRFVDGQEPEMMPVFADNVTAVLVRPPSLVLVASAGDPFSESWGVLASTSNDGETWSHVMSGRFTALVRLGDDGIYTSTADSPGHVDVVPGMGIWRTSGPGTQWSPHNSGLVHARSLALASSAGTVCAQAGPFLAVSHDHGVSWEASEGRFIDTFGLEIAVHPAGDVFSASVPWVASRKPIGSPTTNYLVNRSRDGGATWTPLDAPSSLSASIRVTAAGSVLIPAYSGVARSTDRGDTWQVESSGLPFECIAIQTGPVARVFTSAWGFTYMSEDDGVNWQQIGSVGGWELAVSPLENRVFVGDGPIYQLDEIPGGGDWSMQELPPLQDYGSMVVDEAGTVYVASDAVWFKGVTDTGWQAIPGTPPLGATGYGAGQSILIDDLGFLYVGTAAHSVLRSRAPVGRDPTNSEPGFTIGAWQTGPTPFRRQTAFVLELGDHAPVSLALYDIGGRAVSILWEGSRLGAGRHVATWRPGPEVASGTYYYRLVAGRSTRTGRVTLIR